MARITTMRDDEHKATMVVLGIRPNEMFSEEFRDWLENMFLCVTIKGVMQGDSPDDTIREYEAQVSECVQKAALIIAHEIGKRMSSDPEEMYRRTKGIMDGGIK